MRSLCHTTILAGVLGRIGCSIMLVTVLITQPVCAAQRKADQVFMEAEHIAYDNKQAIVVAKGNVEVVRGERILLADSIYYFPEKDIVRANGNIRLLQPDGNVLFADNLQLEQAFKRGIVNEFKARLKDNAAFVAAQAKRVSDTKVVLRKAVYSPCKMCADTQDPLWQLKANKVTIDDEEQIVTYNNATFEVAGLPVAYTPYFSHPTPDADRKTGVLPPEYGQSTNLGASLKVPYYINIAPDKDATLTPWLTAKEGPVLIGEYRQLTDNGTFQFNGSATFPKKRDNTSGDIVAGNEFRGHIFATGRSRINEDWHWGFDVNRASDDTYLRRYRFGYFDTLTSRAYTERIDNRDYTSIETLAFQGLEEGDDPDKEPYILPSAQYHVESKPLWLGSRASLDAGLLSLARQTGADSRRLHSQLGYTVPYTTSGGHLLEASVGARIDAYDENNVDLGNGREFSGTESRAVPHAALSWRYPLLTRVGSSDITVEPHIKFITTTRGNNSDNISNEDSQTPEFSDLNLFDINRFAGLDRLEEGTRAVVGISAQTQLGNNTSVYGMIGQNIQLDGNNVLPLSNDPDRDYSDVIGNLGYDNSHVALDYRYRLDTDDVALRRSELRALASHGRASLSVDHLRIQNDVVLDDRNDITAGASLKITDNVAISAFGRRDLLRDNMVIAGGSAIINYDCVTFYPAVTREYTRDRDFKPDTSITMKIGLKGLSN